MTFKDHFSQRAALYAAYRPRYPAQLFDYLAGLTTAHDVALDCGTGNGQAAVELANHFRQVIATDPSAPQLAKATQRENIDYRVARAEESGLAPQSVDLVTAAQSLHWFDASAFFAEAKRVLKSDGAIAVWGYGDPVLDTAELQQLLHAFNRVKLESYWFAERQILLDGFRTIDFPFVEVETPVFQLSAWWTLAELLGYLRTWSSTARFVEQHAADPVSELETSIAPLWGDPDTAREIRWPLHLRVGKLRA